MGPGPGAVMWAYVFSAVLSVCGVSPGLSGRTVVVMTCNLKVQMSPLALCGHWYAVAPSWKINKWPLLYVFALGLWSRRSEGLHMLSERVVLQIWASGTLNSCVSTAEVAFSFLFGGIQALLRVSVSFSVKMNFANMSQNSFSYIFNCQLAPKILNLLHICLFWSFAEILNVTL